MTVLLRFVTCAAVVLSGCSVKPVINRSVQADGDDGYSLVDPAQHNCMPEDAAGVFIPQGPDQVWMWQWTTYPVGRPRTEVRIVWTGIRTPADAGPAAYYTMGKIAQFLVPKDVRDRDNPDLVIQEFVTHIKAYIPVSPDDPTPRKDAPNVWRDMENGFGYAFRAAPGNDGEWILPGGVSEADAVPALLDAITANHLRNGLAAAAQKYSEIDPNTGATQRIPIFGYRPISDSRFYSRDTLNHSYRPGGNVGFDEGGIYVFPHLVRPNGTPLAVSFVGQLKPPNGSGPTFNNQTSPPTWAPQAELGNLRTARIMSERLFPTSPTDRQSKLVPWIDVLNDRPTWGPTGYCRIESPHADSPPELVREKIQAFVVACTIPDPLCGCGTIEDPNLELTAAKKTLSTVEATTNTLRPATAAASLTLPTQFSNIKQTLPIDEHRVPAAVTVACQIDWTCPQTITIHPLWVFFDRSAYLAIDPQRRSCNHAEPEQF